MNQLLIFKRVLSGFSSLTALLLIFLLSSAKGQTVQQGLKKEVMAPKRELRGVWIATVANIDWPSSKHLDPSLQRQEFIRILDNLQLKGINCVMVQVRDAADAFYAKSTEPWSEWLNGRQGQGPEPFYDPLEFFIKEAHKRSMEIHAWLNPYRAVFNIKRSSVNESHITRLNPGWFFTFGTTRLFNPGIPAVRAYIVRIVTDLVKNYDVDGIHFDDYFYPYPEKGQSLSDGDTFEDFPNGFSEIDDWRRNNVNILVRTLHDSITAAKPWVKFGISPFGTWKNASQDPQGSGTHGFNSYTGQFADTRLWVKNGWVDYINPQIYFATSSHAVPFEALVNWWNGNTYGRQLDIGIGAYKIGVDPGSWRDPALISTEMDICRKNEHVQGQVFFSAQSMIADRLGFGDTLRNKYYRFPALMPLMNWKDTIPPNPPYLLNSTTDRQGVHLSWTAPAPGKDGEGARYYVIYRFDDNEAVDLGNPARILKVVFGETQFTDTFFTQGRNYFYVVTSLDRMQNESSGICNIYVQLKGR